MATHLSSTRFGDLDVTDAETIDFPDGLVGLPGTRWALLRRDGDDAPFAWLQSLDDPALALPVTRPETFFPAFDVVLDEGDVPGLTDPDAVDVWVVVRAIGAVEEFTANLRAPLLLIGGTGRQVINRADEAPLRAPLVAAA
ncbi:flagellar assembly protein FliW [Patulibacter sp. NPDC049589]|uniref:flagellar assembly protein FliW n=1 Tax=Patulibacter sp. NPDC049589 TaxID=3154731 RepID=UPI003422268F